ncbi:MAG: 50S ribosomal protein L19 [Chloroflexi bacterium]|nr:50S ribosomal protein L19 [Chloroflexota bacterium]
MEAYRLIKLDGNPRVQEFRSGDTVKVNVRLREGDKVRLQPFQGVVLRKRGVGPGATFTVRRVSHGVGVERTFPTYSKLIDSVEVLKHGDVRRSRIYYLRGLSGRAARLKERAQTFQEQPVEEAPPAEAQEEPSGE